MRKASSVRGEDDVSAKAFFIMIALVENNIAARNVMIKPIVVLLSRSFCKVVRISSTLLH